MITSKSTIRKTHNNSYKFKVALEALKEQKTIATLAKEFSIHPTQINKWKKQLKEKGSTIFEQSDISNRTCKNLESQIDQLNQYIGELSVENKFFKKKFNF